MNERIQMETIGIIHSPFTELRGMPVQSLGVQSAEGNVVINEAYAEGLADLGGFSHIYLVYHFHKATRTELRVVFRTWTPRREGYSPPGHRCVRLISGSPSSNC